MLGEEGGTGKEKRRGEVDKEERWGEGKCSVGGRRVVGERETRNMRIPWGHNTGYLIQYALHIVFIYFSFLFVYIVCTCRYSLSYIQYVIRYTYYSAVTLLRHIILQFFYFNYATCSSVELHISSCPALQFCKQ